MNQRIDKYLKNYGKPPRAFVRAMYDPSDANIRKWLAEEQKRHAIINYMISREAEMAPDVASVHMDSGADFMTYYGTEITSYLDPHDPASLDEIQALKSLESAHGTVTVHVRLIGGSATQAIELIKKLNLIFDVAPITAATARQNGITHTPTLVITNPERNIAPQVLFGYASASTMESYIAAVAAQMATTPTSTPLRNTHP